MISVLLIKVITSFVQFVLGLSPENVNAKFRSGGELLSRPLSSGHQEISTDESLYPVSKPITKLEALAQCSGNSFCVLKFVIIVMLY